MNPSPNTPNTAKSFEKLLEQTVANIWMDGEKFATKIGKDLDYPEYRQKEYIESIRNLILTRVIRKDFDIPAEMEKAGRDFQKLEAIARTGGIINKYKADQRLIVRGE